MLQENTHIILDIGVTSERVFSEIFFPNFCAGTYQRALVDHFNLSCLTPEVYLAIPGSLLKCTYRRYRLFPYPKVYAIWQKAIPDEHKHLAMRLRYNVTSKSILINGHKTIYHLRF